MARYDAYPLLPETAMEGFTYGLITPLNHSEALGAGFLEGPDGSRAGIQWEVTDSTYILRLERAGPDHWGVYRVGFTVPVRTVGDLVENLQGVLARLRIIYARARVQ